MYAPTVHVLRASIHFDLSSRDITFNLSCFQHYVDLQISPFGSSYATYIFILTVELHSIYMAYVHIIRQLILKLTFSQLYV